MLDGEAVVLGADGISDFNALHSRKYDEEVRFCAFDILAEAAMTSACCRCRCGRRTWSARLRHFKNSKEIPYAEIQRRGAGMYRDMASRRWQSPRHSGRGSGNRHAPSEVVRPLELD
ncbi:hypothetical protein [Bradyrhizobium sp. 138]|uniref:hypothetical protein n=1 Tax=Bradyrhizobium sp. 138 TaxID=2782615 RepID=UPI003209FFD2